MFSEIIAYFTRNYQEFFKYLYQHIELSFTSLLIASLIGIPLGYIAFKFNWLTEVLSTTSQLLRLIPSLALLFILIPFIGVGRTPAIIALVFLAIPSILLNTILGFKEVPTLMKEVATGLGMNSNQLLLRIEFPLALPYILNGIKLAMVEVIASATLATYIGAGGLGTLIFTGLGLYRMDLLVIGGVSVAILSIMSMYLMELVIKKVGK